jgi:peptide deformylase
MATDEAPASDGGTGTDVPSPGRVRPITRWGAEVMHRELHPVTVFDQALRDLAADMVATMHAADGVGLAACQVGVDLQLFVYDCPDDEGVDHRGVICNPRLTLPTGRDLDYDKIEEGCLSLPGAFEDCKRPDSATVDGADLDGRPITVAGTGLFARCLQHETDHCQGTVFADRLGSRARKRLDRKAAAKAESYPADWPVSPQLDLPIAT